MVHASRAVVKTVALIGGLFLVASLYASVIYYPLHYLCCFCITGIH